jgi:hypothetical protein
MKKFFAFLIMAAVMATAFIACNDDDDDDDDNQVQSYLVKTIEFSADWNRGTSGYEFFYDANNRVTHFDRTYDDAADGAFVYNFGTTGKLGLTKDGSDYNTYDIDAQYRVIKEPWSADEWASWEYNADGYISKGYEHWGGEDHLKYMIEYANGNVTRITTYDDDGVTAKRIKEFVYTTGDNVNNLQQTNVIDSDWKPVGGFYGKASKKLVDHFEYWDPRENPIEKKTSSFAYEFDDKDRPTKVTKTLADMSVEIWEYSYYEQ